jgi:predicted dehydrogenase
VWICTPTASHRQLLERAAAAKLAIFCEKPLAPNLADAEAMAATVERAGVINQVGLVLRTAPVFATLRDIVRSGRLGRPMAAVFRDDQYLPNQGQYASAWRADVTIAGGGTLIEHSIHDLDILRWMLGEVESVTGRSANFAGHEGIEDLAVATLTFASGATASLTSVWHQILTRPSTRRLEVVGEEGIALIDEERYPGRSEGPLRIETDGAIDELPCPMPAWVEELPISDPAWRRYAGEYAPANRAFLEAVADGRPAAPDLGVAVAAHRVADAVYRSAGAGGVPMRVVVG